jgi:hypothetical protein
MRTSILAAVLACALTSAAAHATNSILPPTPELVPAAAPSPFDRDHRVLWRSCGTVSPTAAEREQVNARLSLDFERYGVGRVSATIPVAVHVITDGAVGSVTDAQIRDQIGAMNRGYAGTGFRFTLSSIDRTDNHAWFKMGPGAEKQAKQALAIDPAHHLNLYVCGPGKGILGWAYFPFSLPEDSFWHGVVVHFGTLPGGDLTGYNLGGTAVHEVGHYLGLFHTFEGGCTPPGDEVDDTPFEGSPAFGCPVGRNTCPQPGDDPIHNYMDYTDDDCYTEFTAGQIQRMDAIAPAYRPGLFSGNPIAGDLAGRGTLSESVEGRPMRVELRGAFPNPAHGETVFRFAVPATDQVTLRIFNVAGQRVATLIDARLPAGEHSALFRFPGLSPGVYFAELRVGGVRQSRSVVLTR